MINGVSFYIEIFVDIYNVEKDKITLIIFDFKFGLSGVNLDYMEIFNDVSYKFCNKKVKGIGEYENYI